MSREKYPTRPADLPPDMTLVELATAYGHHCGRLVDAHHGIGEALASDQLAAHAVAALAVQHELAARSLSGRWVNARDALRNGATLDQVVDAMALDVDEVVLGFSRWAGGQRREKLITDDEYAEIMALVGDHR